MAGRGLEKELTAIKEECLQERTARYLHTDVRFVEVVHTLMCHVSGFAFYSTLSVTHYYQTHGSCSDGLQVSPDPDAEEQ